MRPGGDDDLLRIMSEIERGRREMREQYQRQQLMIDLVAGMVWIVLAVFVFMGR